MNYTEIKISVTSEGIEALLNALSRYGIDDAVIEDPEDIRELMEKKHSYEWDYVDEEVAKQITAEPAVLLYLEEGQEGQNRMKLINQALADLKKEASEGNLISINGKVLKQEDLGSLTYSKKLILEEDWKDKWKEYFRPAKVTDRIVVKPTWETYEKKSPDELIIEIDPGMAFGTGTHETTTMCMQLLEKYAGEDSSVLDVGTGSGILAIAAGLLGIKEVLGVDIDPIAVEVARENVKLNHMSNMVNIQQGDLTKGIDFKADVVLGNLMADLVMMLSADVAKHMKENGVFISSGILSEKKELVADTIKSKGFEILEIREKGGWCAIAARIR